jgi:hypothetical protein
MAYEGPANLSEKIGRAALESRRTGHIHKLEGVVTLRDVFDSYGVISLG